MTPTLWTLAALAYLLVACVTYAVLCYFDGICGLEDPPPPGNAVPAFAWPLTLALVAVFLAIAIVMRLVIQPMRRIGAHARSIGEEHRTRGERGGS